MKRSIVILVLLGVASATEAQMSQSVKMPSIDIGVAALPVIDFSGSRNGAIRAFNLHDDRMSMQEAQLQFRQTLFVPAMLSLELSSYPQSLNSRVPLYHQYQSEDSGDIWDDHGKEIAIVAVALLLVVLIFD